MARKSGPSDKDIFDRALELQQELEEQEASEEARADLAAAAQELGVAPEFLLRAEEDKDITEQVVNRLAKSSKVRLREMRIAEPDLEEIFMRATQRSWEIETPLGPIKTEHSDPDPKESKTNPKRAGKPRKPKARKRKSR